MQASLIEALQRNPHPPLATKHHQQTKPAPYGHYIPNVIFQTDVRPPPEEETKSWTKHGFNRVFMDDDQAMAWVEKTFAGTDIPRVFKELPLVILKADMLRYLYLLAEGGVYSDIDTRALAPISEWAQGAVSWPSGKPPTQPVRMVVGIEGDLHVWRNWGSTYGLGFSVTGRHRNFQIAQWTIASDAHHPILVDCIRRITDTFVVAQAWNITHYRAIEMLEAEGRWTHAHKLRLMRKPWEGDVKGERMSVQEWTGPAAFTDAVLSYLLAVGGIREQDLYGLEQPVQVGDVVVLPTDGYNPLRETLPNPRAKAIHLFRGSWKDNWDSAVHLDD
ncbi:uncharacterized protein EI90DRAFT_3181902 [Cantharellus anzutake]|uniref:uncharacterized protein n=1 Tax=Cantharellus anzutake TaxID=1750568 RepID=UPI001905223C|nr:uncharacterized protein EI90DRAFT_3181902 [Cantharellus anzutake]KAF8334339.1 hypothetical protein EI90DRAFT_3181902 [Cantharellus anzutake]